MQLDRIGNWVRLQRLARGLTQKQLSEIAGISKGRIEAIESGHCMEMRLATVQAVLVALGGDLAAAIPSASKA